MLLAHVPAPQLASPLGMAFFFFATGLAGAGAALLAGAALAAAIATGAAAVGVVAAAAVVSGDAAAA
ncbi:MAG TPA: hypothetical protein VK762_22920, partial [Polyangiaceae bacterium]|nr:hypothetical protein [Polyangiaceae bacterium]